MVLFKKLTFSDKAHDLAEFEEDEVNVGHLVSDKEGLVCQVSRDWLDPFKDESRNSGAVASCVGRHGDGTLEVSNNTRHHLDVSEFFRGSAKKVWAVLRADVPDDRAALAELQVSINEVRQIWESNAEGILDAEPRITTKFWSITYFVQMLIEIDA